MSSQIKKRYLSVCSEEVRVTVQMLLNGVEYYIFVRKYQCLTTVVCVYFSRKLNFNIIFTKYYKIQHPGKSLP
jgi:hypothetical protein